MTHIPTSIDIKTDLRRAVMASFSKDGFNDPNAKVFLENAEKILSQIQIDKKTFIQVTNRLQKAKDSVNPIEKRREDVLTASSLVF